MAIDYFTKQLKAEPLAKITKTQMKDFIWKSIIFYFNLPTIIITNNDKQFSCYKLVESCKDLGIVNFFTSIGHPQANGEAEITNLLQGLKI